MEIASGEFASCPKSQIGADTELPVGWVVIRHDQVPFKSQRRELYGKWVAIQSEEKTIYRILRFSPTLPKDGIVIDWGGWIDLQGDREEFEKNLKLKISTVPWHQAIRLPFFHVDHSVRISSYLGALSLVIAIVSLIIALNH